MNVKIILATPIYLPDIGGPSIYIKELVEQLRDRHELVVVTYSDEGEEIPGSRLVKISKQLPLLVRLQAFYRAIKDEAQDADVMYIQNAVAAGLPAALAARKTNTRFVVKFVGDEAWERAFADKRTKKLLIDFLKAPDDGVKTKIFRFIQSAVLHRADIVTTPSRYLGEAITDSYDLNPEKVKINYNASPLPELSEPVERDSYLLNYVGRLVPHKHLDELIRVVVDLKSEFPELKLTIAGEGPEFEKLDKLIIEKNATDYISLPGRLGRDEVANLMHRSVAHILNSSYEGLPHTALETFAGGAVLIATDIPGTRELAKHDNTALTHSVHDTEALKQNIRTVLTNEVLRNKLTTNGRSLLNDQFSWENHLSNLENFFHS